MISTSSILRKLTLYFANWHFKNSQKKNHPTYFPPSGKVLGTEELSNMIDASLDMWLTTGRFNTIFEKNLADFVGVKYALTVNSGSSANLLALTALTSYKLGDRRLKPGDEVITVACGFPATVSPIIQVQAIPVFVDVDLETHNVNTQQLEEAITPKTKAIMIAHTLGNPFDLGKVLELASSHDLWLIEDNCDALGSTYNGKKTGSFGHLSTLSFYPAHHITMGEGGAVLTSDPELKKIVQSFRDWGRDCWCPPGKDNTCQCRFNWTLGLLPKGYDHKYCYSHIGYNLKITDWQAAIGVAQLEKAPAFIEIRRQNFQRLSRLFLRYSDTLMVAKPTINSDPSWFGFLVTVKKNAPFTKLELVQFLEKKGIGTRQLFSGNLLRHPGFLNTPYSLKIRSGSLLDSTQLTDHHFNDLPNTEIIMNQTFWIGVWPGLTDNYFTAIETAFKEWYLQHPYVS